MRYEVAADGTLVERKVFYDLTRSPEPVALDGIKVDQKGNLYVSAPGGFGSSRRRASTSDDRPARARRQLRLGRRRRKTLYLTASTGLYRIRVKVPGIRPPSRGVQAASR